MSDCHPPVEGGYTLLSFEDAGSVLDEAASGFPPEFFDSLNGGISLSPEYKVHPDADGLYVLGEYHNDPTGLGNHIVLYYGSFARVCAGLPNEEIRKKLRETLRHEFTHHVEFLAGARDLERRDEADLERYRRV